jgi:single-stranded-DNA-specific exonuclease
MATFRFPDSDAQNILDNYSPLINRLLENRGLLSSEEASAFIAPNYETQLHDPRLLHDVETAVERIKTAIERKEKIVIFSDYDCDGIPGAVVLHDLFKAIPYENFSNYIPHRHYEGFGLSTEAVEKIAKEGGKLIITIDCGTTDVEAVAKAKELGVDVIITDHHEPREVLPDAVALVNPKLGEYPFKDLCGAAVAFKLAQVVLEELNHTLTPGQEKWWLDMVGIATIADMVPLVGENRVFAHYGLHVLKKSRRPGLQQLLQKNRVNQRFLTEEDIGFTIGPRINAASRMDNPEDAFNVLTATDVSEAGSYVDHLEKLNTERKTMVAQMTKDLHKRLQKLTEIPEVIVLGNPEWRPSLVGLAANKLAEEHGKPVFLWGKDGNGTYKGSCRSGGGISVVELMRAATDVFLEHGGHHFSGGFSVKDDEIFNFGEKLNEAFVALGEDAAIKEEVLVDEVLALEDVTYRLADELTTLAPYGTGNEKPLFAFKDVTPRKVEQFGKGKEHLKLTFETDNNSVEAISFFATEDSFAKKPSIETSHTLIGHVEKSFFMGRQQLRIRIVDIV